MQTTSAADSLTIRPDVRNSAQRRNLFGACLAHLLHDGYTDQLYALLPIWQTDFGLSYAGLAVVRSITARWAAYRSRATSSSQALPHARH
jgi:MFS transporter, FSR family, fosmidomycin resistance protein